jgi:hypothetical protein
MTELFREPGQVLKPARPRGLELPVSPTETRSVLEEGYYPAYRGDMPLVVGVAQRDKLERMEACPRLYRGQVLGLTDEGFPYFVSVPETRFAEDVILEPALQDEIERHVRRFAERESAYREAGLPFRRGVILGGPLGVGKTHVFRALTHALAGRFVQSCSCGRTSI